MIKASDLKFRLRLDSTSTYIFVPDSTSGRTPGAWTRALKMHIPRPSDFVAHPLVSETGTSHKIIIQAIRDGLPGVDIIRIIYPIVAAGTSNIDLAVTFPYDKALAITYDGAGVLSVYEDGVLRATVTNAVSTADDNSTMTFGSASLSIAGTEIDYYYRSNYVVSNVLQPVGNIGAWAFDDGADRIAVDSSLGNNGTIYGDFTWALADLPSTIAHSSAMLSLLATQFRGQPNFEKMLAAIAPTMQHLEQVFHEILVYVNLSYAPSTILDSVGKEIGEEREGRSDEDYRAAIAVREVVNSSGGQPEVLIGLIERVTGGSALYSELYPATIEMYSAGKLIPSKLHSSISAAVPAGVQLAIIQGKNPFVFDGDPSGAGFSEVNMTVDGLFTEVFQQ